jgi:endonuclease/exonuclease/phosphatase family metal-dependent hydrolase
MQKSFYCIIGIVFAALCCSGKEESKAFLEVSPESVTFGPEAGSKTVNVNASGEFTATVSSGNAWCTVATPASGKLSIQVSANSGVERTAVVTVFGEALERTVAVKQSAVASPTAELILPRENEVFDLWNVSTVVFQWKVTNTVPEGCKVLISPSPDMTSAIAFFPTAEQSSALAATPTEMDAMLDSWNISPNTETTVYWTVAAKAESQSVNVNSQPRAVRLKRMPANQIIRVMSYNIHNAQGMDNIVNYQRIADIIINATPDAIALQEVDSVTTRSKGVDVLLRLANLTSMVPTYSPDIAIYGGKYGNGVLSKQQPLSCKRIPLPGKAEARSLLIMEFKDYVFCCTHLDIEHAESEAARVASVGIINQAVQDFNKPVLLAGDLNDVPDMPAINAFKQKWTILSDTKQHTWRSDNPTITLDYILGYSNGCKYPVVQTQVLNEPMGSDHRPLFVDVRVITND